MNAWLVRVLSRVATMLLAIATFYAYRDIVGVSEGAAAVVAIVCWVQTSEWA